MGDTAELDKKEELEKKEKPEDKGKEKEEKKKKKDKDKEEESNNENAGEEKKKKKDKKEGKEKTTDPDKLRAKIEKLDAKMDALREQKVELLNLLKEAEEKAANAAANKGSEEEASKE